MTPKSIAHLWNIVQRDNSSFKLQPPTGTIKLYYGSVVKLFGRYKLKLTREDMVEHCLTFYIINKSPWPIIDGETYIRRCCISMNEVKHVNTLTK